MDQECIDRHFGTDHAQCQKEKAYVLLDGGNIGMCTIMARNAESKVTPGEQLVAFKFKCLSSERPIVHSVYMVFENKEGGEYVPAPASFCSCENGACFCSHVLCFLHVMLGIQRPLANKSQEEIESFMPLDRRVIQGKPCLIENVLARTHIKRQEAQTNRQAAAKKQKIN